MNRFACRCRPTMAALIAAVSLCMSPALVAAELLVVEDPRCPPCVLFEREVASLYARTDEGRRVPLRRLPYGVPPPPSYAYIGQPAVAPTFVLVDRGRELGRFEGYSSDELFWMNLTALLQQFPEP